MYYFGYLAPLPGFCNQEDKEIIIKMAKRLTAFERKQRKQRKQKRDVKFADYLKATYPVRTIRKIASAYSHYLDELATAGEQVAWSRAKHREGLRTFRINRNSPLTVKQAEIAYDVQRGKYDFMRPDVVFSRPKRQSVEECLIEQDARACA